MIRAFTECADCQRTDLLRGCGQRHWRIRLEGFDDHVVAAPSRAAARYRDWRLASEAGYFFGRNGFRDFLQRIDSVHEVIS